MKKINKSSLSAVLIIFGFFVMTLNIWDHPTTSQPIFTEDGKTNELLPNTSQFIPRTIRVAIYNESDTSQPSYASTGLLHNNYTGLKILLEGVGYQVSELTESDILAHKLITADYDVFIMVDNLPRDSITDLVKEFWLGGGGIFSFDSAISYICYAGMIPHESEGSENYGLYWHYAPYSTTQNITERHPVTKDYQVNDTIIEYSMDWAAFNWAALQSTSIASDITKLATKQGLSNLATVVACDPHLKGGRVVQMLGDGETIGENMDNMIIDAIEWLCPRPKGRIVFDLSHQPRLGVDPWDTLSAYPGYYEEWRDNLVNRSYTFDKLYPSASGNFTLDRLSKYDLLVVVLPDLNYSTSELSVITNWVNNGGSLLLMGEFPGSQYIDGDKRINLLLAAYNLEMNLTYVESNTIDANANLHPTIEGCANLQMDLRGAVNISGDAYALWEHGGNIHVACQDTGNGRIILVADMNWVTDSQIANQDNRQFSINAVNWLTASQAKILIYVDEDPNDPDPNDNLYRGPVATALNDLGLPFYLTFTRDYLNISFHEETWNLIVIDNAYYVLFDDADFNEDIISYVENGGFLIMSTWYYSFSVGNKLWDYCGFEYAGDVFLTPPTIHIWDNAHRIFNNPALYSADNINSTCNYVNIESSNLTLHNNASAIAGLTNTVSNEGAAIIIGANGRVLTNAMLTTVYYDDTDDSTYPDALEIWENEIAYMLYQSLSVGINNPHTSDIFDATAPDFIISTDGIALDDTWYTLNSGAEYHIASTSGTLNPSAWNGLPDGDVSLKFYVEDSIGQQKYTSVNIVKDSQAPNIIITSPSAGDTFGATALSFIVEITDEHLDKMWYTLNSNSTKYFFTSNGSIDQLAWDALADGSITIRIYANDTVSNEAVATVSVEISTEVPGGIPSYNSYIIIGVIFVISAIIIKRKLKLNKFKI